MTLFATFQRVRGRDWQERVTVRGVFDFYEQHDRSSSSPHKSAHFWRMRHDFGDALVASWNSMSRACEYEGERYLVHFELTSREGGDTEVQSLVDGLSPRSPDRARGPLRLIHDRTTSHYNNVTAIFPAASERTMGIVPRASPDNRGGAQTDHQPWSSVMLLGPDASRYTMMHEVGHILGLGEGYRLTFRRVRVSPDFEALADARYETMPEYAGTPMANPDEAGRDANEPQLDAIVGYCLAALRAGGGGSQYGRAVDHYRARRIDDE